MQRWSEYTPQRQSWYSGQSASVSAPPPRRGDRWIVGVIITAVVVLVGSIGWYLGNYFDTGNATVAVKESTNSTPEPEIADPPSVEVPAVLKGDTNNDGVYSHDELAVMDPADVAQIDPALLVTIYGPQFDGWRQQTYDIQVNLDTLSGLANSVLRVPFGPKSDYGDQDVLNQVTLDTADASIQDDPVDGGRMLALPHSPALGDFHALQDQIIHGGHNVNILNVYKQDDTSYPRVEGDTFANIDLSKYEQVRVIKRKLLPNKKSDGQNAEANEYGIYGLLKNGTSESWQLIKIATPADQDFYRDLTGLLATVGRRP